MDDETARELVVNAADRLFYGRGIQAVGVDAIREEAGISLKRVYSLFPSKESILAEVLRRRNAAWTTGILAAASRVESPTDKLLSIYDFLADWFAEDDFRGCAFINSFGELGATAPLVADAARSHKLGFQEYVSELVDDAHAPASLAPQLVLLAEGAQTTAAILGSTRVASDARAAASTLLQAALSTSSLEVPTAVAAQ